MGASLFIGGSFCLVLVPSLLSELFMLEGPRAQPFEGETPLFSADTPSL